MDGTIKNVIRIGRVNSIDEKSGMVRVLFDDKDDLVSDWLPLFSFEYSMPKVGEQVLCIFLLNGIQQGFCLRGFFSDIDKPPVQDKDIYFKKFDDDTSIQYNKKTKEFLIKSAKTINLIASNGVNVTGDVDVNGNIQSSGTIIDTKGNSNHHTHP